MARSSLAAWVPLADQHGGAAGSLVAAAVLGAVLLVLVAGIVVTARQRRRVAPARSGAAPDPPPGPAVVELSGRARADAERHAGADARFVPAMLEDAVRRAARDPAAAPARRLRIAAVDAAARPPTMIVDALLADGATERRTLVLDGPPQQPWRTRPDRGSAPG